MTAPARTVTILVMLGFIAYLLWSTLAAQHVECSVTVDFRGRPGTGTASAASEEEAVREAQTIACGPLAGSMDERLACAGRAPVSRTCHAI